ncbi:MAG: hypothetical protein ABIG61_00005, partial [Planctomycetota bacterium]
TVDGVQIPYEETRSYPRSFSVNIPKCTRVEIQYKPSVLDYFFPYEFQQSLLSPTEIKSLQSMNTVVVEDTEKLEPFVTEVSQLTYLGMNYICETSLAYVNVYQGKEKVISFPI